MANTLSLHDALPISIALVTDYDVWAEKPVSHHEVLDVMKKNVEKAKKLIAATIERLPLERKCECKEALKYAVQ